MTKTLENEKKEFAENNNAGRGESSPGDVVHMMAPSSHSPMQRSTSALISSNENRHEAQNESCGFHKARSDGNNSTSQPDVVPPKAWCFSAIQNKSLRHPEVASDGGCVYAPFKQPFSLLRSGRSPYQPSPSARKMFSTINGSVRSSPWNTTAYTSVSLGGGGAEKPQSSAEGKRERTTTAPGHGSDAIVVPCDSDTVTYWSNRPSTQPSSPPPQSISMGRRPRSLSHRMEGEKIASPHSKHSNHSPMINDSQASSSRQRKTSVGSSAGYTLRTGIATPVAVAGSRGVRPMSTERRQNTPVQPFEPASNWFRVGIAGHSVLPSSLAGEQAKTPGRRPSSASPGTSSNEHAVTGVGMTLTVDDMEASSASPCSPPTGFPSLPVPPTSASITNTGNHSSGTGTTTTTTATATTAKGSSNTSGEENVEMSTPRGGEDDSTACGASSGSAVADKGPALHRADSCDSAVSTSLFQSVSGTSTTLRAYKNRQLITPGAPLPSSSSSRPQPPPQLQQQQQQHRYNNSSGASIRSLTGGISSSADPRQSARTLTKSSDPPEPPSSNIIATGGFSSEAPADNAEEDLVITTTLHSPRSLSQPQPQSCSPIPPYPQVQFRHFTVATDHIIWEEHKNRDRILAAAVPQCPSIPSDSCCGPAEAVSFSSLSPAFCSDQIHVETGDTEDPQQSLHQSHSHPFDTPTRTAAARRHVEGNDPMMVLPPPPPHSGEEDGEEEEVEEFVTATEDESLSDSGVVAGAGGSSSLREGTRGGDGRGVSQRRRRLTHSRYSIPSCVSISERFGYVATVPSLKRTDDSNVSPPPPPAPPSHSIERGKVGLPHTLSPQHKADRSHPSATSGDGLQHTLSSACTTGPITLMTPNSSHNNNTPTTVSHPAPVTSSTSTISLEHIGETPRYAVVSPQIQSPDLAMEAYAWPNVPGADARQTLPRHTNECEQTASNSLFLAPFNRERPSVSGSVLPAASFCAANAAPVNSSAACPAVMGGIGWSGPQQTGPSSTAAESVLSSPSVMESISMEVISLSRQDTLPAVAPSRHEVIRSLSPPHVPVPAPPPLRPIQSQSAPPPPAMGPLLTVFQDGVSTSSDSNRRAENESGSMNLPLSCAHAGSPRASYSSTASPLSRHLIDSMSTRTRTVQSSASAESSASSPQSPPLPQAGTTSNFTMSATQSKEPSKRGGSPFTPIANAGSADQQQPWMSEEDRLSPHTREPPPSSPPLNGGATTPTTETEAVTAAAAAAMTQNNIHHLSPPPALSFPTPVQMSTNLTLQQTPTVSNKSHPRTILPSGDETRRSEMTASNGEKQDGSAPPERSAVELQDKAKKHEVSGGKPTLVISDSSTPSSSKPLEKEECSSSGGLLGSTTDPSVHSSLSPSSPVVSDCPTAVGGHHLALKCGRYFLKETCAAREERFYEAIRPYQEQLLAVAATMPPAALAAYSQAHGWVEKEPAPKQEPQPRFFSHTASNNNNNNTISSSSTAPPPFTTPHSLAHGTPSSLEVEVAPTTTTTTAGDDPHAVSDLSVFDEAVGSEHWWKLNDKSTFQPYVAAFAAQKEKKTSRHRSRSPGGDTTASSSVTSNALPSPGHPHRFLQSNATLVRSHTADSLHTDGADSLSHPPPPPTPPSPSQGISCGGRQPPTAPPTPMMMPLNDPAGGGHDIPHSPTLPFVLDQTVDDAQAEVEAYEESKATALRLMASFIPLYRGKAGVTSAAPNPTTTTTGSAFPSTEAESAAAGGEEDTANANATAASKYTILSPREWKAVVDDAIVAANNATAAAAAAAAAAQPSSNGKVEEKNSGGKGGGPLVASKRGLSGFLSPQYIEMIVLEDVCHGFQFPCVLDMKMGKRQYGLRASEKKKNSKTMKANLSTSAKYGIRLAGYRKYDVESQSYISKGKIDCRYLTLKELHEQLSFFLGHNRSLDIRFRQQVERLRSAFSQQRVFRFFTSSLLFVYDAAKPVETARVVMIDFAFTYERRELLDEKDEDAPFEFDLGYLRALDTLLSLLA